MGSFHCGRDGQRQLAGWELGLDLVQGKGQEGEWAVRRNSPSWGSGLLLVPGGICTLGGKVGKR